MIRPLMIRSWSRAILSRWLAPFCRRREGATAVEFALLLLPTLALILGTVEVGRFMWMQASLQYVADTAARCAAVDPTNCGSQTQLQAYAAAHSPGINFSLALNPPSAPCTGKTIVATSLFQTAIPHLQEMGNLFQKGPITLTVQACVLH